MGGELAEEATGGRGKQGGSCKEEVGRNVQSFYSWAK
jgi:hypothetical protein